MYGYIMKWEDLKKDPDYKKLYNEYIKLKKAYDKLNTKKTVKTKKATKKIKVPKPTTTKKATPKKKSTTKKTVASKKKTTASPKKKMSFRSYGWSADKSQHERYQAFAKMSADFTVKEMIKRFSGLRNFQNKKSTTSPVFNNDLNYLKKLSTASN